MQTKTDPGPPVFLTSSYSPPTSNLSNQIRPTLSFLVFTLLYNFYIQPRANTITSVGASLLPNIRFWLYTSYISTSAFYIFTSASIIFLLYVCPAPRTSPPPPPPPSSSSSFPRTDSTSVDHRLTTLPAPPERTRLIIAGRYVRSGDVSNPIKSLGTIPYVRG